MLKYDFVAQATLVTDLLHLAQLESSDLAEELGGGLFWGSSGSVADSAGLGHSVEPMDEERQRDSLEFRQILIRLAEQMKTQGVSSERSEYVGKALRRGLEMERSQERDS